jgi:Neuraminidase (sialidase)
MSEFLRPSLDDIYDFAISYFGESVFENTRQREVVDKRKVVHYVANIRFGYGVTSIGFALGNKNHATVLSGVKSITELKDRIPYIKNMVDGFGEFCLGDTKIKKACDVVGDLIKSDRFSNEEKDAFAVLIKISKK